MKCATATLLAQGLSSPTKIDAHNSAALFFLTANDAQTTLNRLAKPAP